MGRFPSRWHAAESLSPAGSYNYSSSVLAADVRAIFRLAKMTSPPPNWHVCILACLWLHTLLWQKDRWPICGPCVHSEIFTDQHHQTGSVVVTDGGWLSSIAKKDESWLPDRAAKFSLCCWACAGALSKDENHGGHEWALQKHVIHLFLGNTISKYKLATANTKLNGNVSNHKSLILNMPDLNPVLMWC